MLRLASIFFKFTFFIAGQPDAGFAQIKNIMAFDPGFTVLDVPLADLVITFDFQQGRTNVLVIGVSGSLDRNGQPLVAQRLR